MRMIVISVLLLSLTGLALIPVAAQSPTPLPTTTHTPTPTPYPPEPDGCLRPPDDYTRVQVNGATLNQRTLAMLAHAQELYGGRIDLTGRAITQGSYNAGAVSLSFGTHDAGGAVDISVRNIPGDWSILWDDIPVLIEALRTAGFAAWYRDEDDGMSPHIHAIAIGDAELSRAAALQLDGRYGYFRGYNGLPQTDGMPLFDEDGAIILCNWMRDLGYEDLRDAIAITEPPYEFLPGDAALINMTWGQELNMRSAPGLSNTIVAKLQPETRITIIGGPEFADGYRWWQFTLEDGTEGWAVEAVNGMYTIVR